MYVCMCRPILITTYLPTYLPTYIHTGLVGAIATVPITITLPGLYLAKLSALASSTSASSSSVTVVSSSTGREEKEKKSSTRAAGRATAAADDDDDEVGRKRRMRMHQVAGWAYVGLGLLITGFCLFSTLSSI